jgi:hypothetical protein
MQYPELEPDRELERKWIHVEVQPPFIVIKTGNKANGAKVTS